MSNEVDARPGLSLTSRYLTRDGHPVIPVSGEIHYSRVPRHRWVSRLRQMRSGGVTVISAYAFWLHHVPERGRPRFDGNRDVGAFLDACAAEGFDVVLRIGPWCHGETRNGGFPDWVQDSPVRHRTDDPAYLALVSEWFSQLAAQVAGRSLAGLQLENELYDQPGHLLTLKRLARAAGLSAPLWTATAWGGAELPAEEVFPLYGGYGDGFWVDADAPWDPTFREHYFFSHVWDDPGIGADLRRSNPARPARSPSPLFPPATCELGGGMATAYHRRPRPSALDVAAIAHGKIGNGSAWQGYYMYAGGTNPPGTQESHASGYPNDMTPLGYDFHAPIGEAGLLSGSHALLRQQHAFLAAFGPALAEMPSSLPDLRPSGVEDVRTLRYALRSNGDSGFLFISWHQPHVPLPDYAEAQFAVRLDDRSVVLPASPMTIPAGTLARWPLGWDAGGVRLDWVTASALTVLPGARTTLVCVESAGIPVSYSVGGVVHEVEASTVPVRVSADADLLVLPASVADAVWVDVDRRRLFLSADELTWDPDGVVTARTSSAYPEVRVYAAGGFVEVPMRRAAPSLGAVADGRATLVRRAGGAVPVAYGKFDGRQSAPSAAVFEELAAVFSLSLPRLPDDLDGFIRISWAGDVAQLRVDGRTVTDRFWDGSDWVVSLRDAGYAPGSSLTLHVLPLAAGSPVWLPEDARDRLLGSLGELLAVDAIELLGLASWPEA
ncbi:beta-galactosidase [Actinoplanes sp. TBRC 11911]|nr:beta-galactosidase [Actinoplanes sp. TBRC 11911]